MTWQDWTVAAIGIVLAVWLVIRVVRRVQGIHKAVGDAVVGQDHAPQDESRLDGHVRLA